MEKLILGIETSCDECSASVLIARSADRWTPISVATFSQIELHEPFGGVVPEVASRNHLEQIHVVVNQALKDAKIEGRDLDAIAVTNRPGLIGALLVGVTAAKAMGYILKKPIVPVHHLEGHLMSVFLSTDANPDPLQKIKFPVVLLMVSGGHTQLHLIESAPALWSHQLLKESLLGRSVDDAAGEAFDKTAKVLGFPYPGGKYLDLQSAQGNRKAFDLPRGLKSGGQNNQVGYDFSFSGLKTAVMQLESKLQKESRLPAELADVCASVQEAILDPLINRAFLAVQQHHAQSLLVVGGVAANRRLRERLQQECKVPVFYPDLKYCTDNAAMIAAAGAVRLHQGYGLNMTDYLKLNAYPVAEY